MRGTKLIDGGMIKKATLVLVVMALFVGQAAFASSPVAINEIMANPVVIDDSDGEWVELRNASNSSVDITGWVLNTGNGSIILPNASLAANEYYVVCRTSSATPACNHVSSSLQLTNTGGTITLSNNEGATVDTLLYTSDDAQPGVSAEVVQTPEGQQLVPNTSSNYPDNETGQTANTGTPGSQNFSPEDTTSPADLLIATIFAAGEPVGCGASIHTRIVRVDWNDDQANDLEGYEYQAKVNGPISFVANSELSLTLPVEAGIYQYRVRAVDTHGNVGEWSQWCTLRLDYSDTIPDCTENCEGEGECEGEGCTPHCIEGTCELDCTKEEPKCEEECKVDCEVEEVIEEEEGDVLGTVIVPKTVQTAKSVTPSSVVKVTAPDTGVADKSQYSLLYVALVLSLLASAVAVSARRI